MIKQATKTPPFRTIGLGIAPDGSDPFKDIARSLTIEERAEVQAELENVAEWSIEAWDHPTGARSILEEESDELNEK